MVVLRERVQYLENHYINGDKKAFPDFASKPGDNPPFYSGGARHSELRRIDFEASELLGWPAPSQEQEKMIDGALRKGILTSYRSTTEILNRLKPAIQEQAQKIPAEKRPQIEDHALQKGKHQIYLARTQEALIRIRGIVQSPHYFLTGMRPEVR